MTHMLHEASLFSKPIRIHMDVSILGAVLYHMVSADSYVR